MDYFEEQAMQMRRMGMAAAVMMAGAAIAARGAEPSPVAPFLDGQTVAVVRLDVAKIDTAAIQQAVEKIFTQQHEPMPGEMQQGMTMGTLAGNALLARFKALGGGQVYAVVAMPDVWPAMAPLAVLIPVGAGGDVAGMEAWVKALPLPGAMGNGDALVVKTLRGNVVFAGAAVALRRLEAMQAQGRPEIEQRLAESTSALTAVVTPTADMRKVVAEMMPRMPAEFGGQSTQALAEHLADVTLQVSLPPAQELVVTAYTGTSAEAAQMVADMAKRALDMARKEPREFGPGGREAAMGPQVMALLDALQPKVAGGSTGETATVRLSDEQMQTVEMLLLPAISHSREQAEKVASMSNLRQIALACNLYMNDKNRVFPAGFDDLKGYLKNDAVLTNPRDPQHRRYVLERWTAADLKRLNDRSAELPIAYEAGEASQVAVAFLDGHVEMEGRSVLQQQLAKAKAGAK